MTKQHSKGDFTNIMGSVAIDAMLNSMDRIIEKNLIKAIEEIKSELLDL